MNNLPKEVSKIDIDYPIPDGMRGNIPILFKKEYVQNIKYMLYNIKEGSNVQDACSIARISYNAVKDWLKIGKQNQTLYFNGEIKELNGYGMFFSDVEYVQGKYQQEVRDIIKNSGNIALLMTMLERKFPVGWGRSDSVKLDIEQEVTITRRVVSASDWQLGSITTETKEIER